MIDKEEHGVNAVFQSSSVRYSRKNRIFPFYGLKVEMKVKYDKLVIISTIPPISIQIKLIAINRIEVTEGKSLLIVEGTTFTLRMANVKSLGQDTAIEVGDRLRFLVIRQRIPHSILGLPFEWEIENVDRKDTANLQWNITKKKANNEKRVKKTPSETSLHSGHKENERDLNHACCPFRRSMRKKW